MTAGSAPCYQIYREPIWPESRSAEPPWPTAWRLLGQCCEWPGPKPEKPQKSLQTIIHVTAPETRWSVRARLKNNNTKNHCRHPCRGHQAIVWCWLGTWHALSLGLRLNSASSLPLGLSFTLRPTSWQDWTQETVFRFWYWLRSCSFLMSEWMSVCALMLVVLPSLVRQ